MANRARGSKRATMHMVIPHGLRAVFDEQMKRGGFHNAGECLRHLIRMEEERLAPEWLEELIEEGLQSPKVPMDDAWLVG